MLLEKHLFNINDDALLQNAKQEIFNQVMLFDVRITTEGILQIDTKFLAAV